MKVLMFTFVVSVFALLARAAVSDHYFYPSGAKPPGIPPDSTSVQSHALTTWEDACVDANDPSRTFGADEWAHVENGYLSRPEAWTLFKFSDAYAYLGDGVVEATLYVYPIGLHSAGASVNVNVSRVLSSWSESSVTWNSKPSAYGSAVSGYGGTPGTLPIAIDVTAAVQQEQQAAAGSRHGIRLATSNGATIYFVQKESAVAGQRPYLHIQVPEPAAPLLILGGLLLSRCSIPHRKLNNQ